MSDGQSPLLLVPEDNFGLEQHMRFGQEEQTTGIKTCVKSNYKPPKESLIAGFALLRALQLISFNIYYIGSIFNPRSRRYLTRSGSIDEEIDGAIDEVENIDGNELNNDERKQIQGSFDNQFEPEQINDSRKDASAYNSASFYHRFEPTVLDIVNQYNPFEKLIQKSYSFSMFCDFIKISLSIIAITIVVDKIFLTVLISSFKDFDVNSINIGSDSSIDFSNTSKHSNDESNKVYHKVILTNNSTLIAATINDTSHTSNHTHGKGHESNRDIENSEPETGLVSFIVLILYQLSELIIVYNTIFNGHLMWNLFNQRLFLVCTRYQYKIMLKLFVFVYIEYYIYIAFIENLYSFSNINLINYSSELPSWESPFNCAINLILGRELASARVNLFLDIISNAIYFTRSMIRISPYIALNYSIACLVVHVENIRSQQLFSKSLKKRGYIDSKNPIKNKQALSNQRLNQNKQQLMMIDHQQSRDQSIFFTSNQNSPVKRDPSINILSDDSLSKNKNIDIPDDATTIHISHDNSISSCDVNDFSNRIKDFEELESYITNLYVYTCRLNRVMTIQGVGYFFVIHNTIISCSLLKHELIKGGPIFAYLINLLVVVIGFLPFYLSYSFDEQLAELSKQIDRIIIQQKFIYRRRDNLVRIRELINDIKINCGSLHFNFKAGLKYTGVAFATAFFIKQERKYDISNSFLIDIIDLSILTPQSHKIHLDYKLTRRAH